MATPIKRYQIDISEDAERDLVAVFSFISNDSPEAALAFVRRLRQAARSLSRFPERGSEHPDSRAGAARHRKLVVTPYLIVYGVRGRTVMVHAFRHGARDDA